MRILLLILFVSTGLALDTGSSVFPVPDKLRGRVQFWVDIYSKYGKYQRVVHHRMYPQAVFTVLDFSQEAQRMWPGELESHIKATENAVKSTVEGILRRLGNGERPITAFEKQIASAMEKVPGGREKYLNAVNDDLVRTQTGIREKFAEAIERSGRYIHFMEKVFAAEGMPVELAKLPFVESSFDYRAISSAGAAGLWQFMPRTGKEFGMRIDSIIDERRDPIIATRAAARYLKGAYNRLGDWGLALTSYNHGIGGVLKKINEIGIRDLPTIIEHPVYRPFGFASNNFFPSFLAALVVIHNKASLFPGVRPAPPLILKEETVSQSTYVSALCRKYGISLESLRVANYALSEKVWEGRVPVPAGYRLRLPASEVQAVTVISPAELAEPTKPSEKVVTSHYVVQAGDTLAGIARKYGMKVSQLKSLNPGLTERIKLGQRIKVIGEAPKTKAIKSRVHIVKKGDTLGKIASVYKVSPSELKRVNNLKSDIVRVGERLNIP
jgi:membrane-bound lytic murein transglycosylase D